MSFTVWVPPMFQDITGYEDQSQEVGDFWQYLVDTYSADHPNVTINLSRLSWDDMDPKTTVAVAAGDPPDVYFDVNGRIYKFYRQGAFDTLEDLYSPDDLEDFWPAAIELSSDPGSEKLFMTPMIAISEARIGLVEDFWAAKGKLDLLPEANGTWTVDQFEAAIEAISDIPNVYPLCTEMANEQGMNQLIFVHNNGGTKFTADDQAIDQSKKEPYARAFSKVYDWYQRGWFAPEPQALSGGECVPLYSQKQIAVFWQPDLATIKDALEAGTAEGPYTIRYVASPTYEDQKPKISGASVGFAVAVQNDPAKRAAIYDFVRWLTSADNMNLYKTSTYAAGWLYARDSVPLDGYPGDPSFLGGQIEIQTDPGYEPMVGAGLFNPAWSETRNCEFPEWQAVFSGAKTVDEATDVIFSCAAAAVANAQ